MGEISDRIRRVCLELAVIDNELTALVSGESGGAPRARVSLQDIIGLKTVVDEFRATLWAYLNGRVGTDDRPFSPAVHDRGLIPISPQILVREKPELRSFFEEVQAFATRLVEEHLNDQGDTIV